MTISNYNIAIIGGGPGGLTLARLLQLNRISVKVYERDRDSTSRIQGGTLDLHQDSGLAALEKAGLMEAFKQQYRPDADRMQLMDKHANCYINQHSENSRFTFGDRHFRPEIDRGPLRDLLLESLQPGTVEWNRHVINLAHLEQGWEINFADGEKIRADIVIGADGSNSKIRPLVTSIKPQWTGITMIEGLVKHADINTPKMHHLLNGGKIFAYGDNKCLILSAKGDGSIGFSLSFPTHESWSRDAGLEFQDRQQMLAWFKATFNGWNSNWQELFDNPDVVYIPRPQYCVPTNQYWKARPDITLIGDAAHWMPPFAGEGVNFAMLDALWLAESLTQNGDTLQAIKEYETKMFKRFAVIGEETMFNTRWMHAPNALTTMQDMFSESTVKKIPFLAKHLFQVHVKPLFRKRYTIRS